MIERSPWPALVRRLESLKAAAFAADHDDHRLARIGEIARQGTTTRPAPAPPSDSSR